MKNYLRLLRMLNKDWHIGLEYDKNIDVFDINDKNFEKVTKHIINEQFSLTFGQYTYLAGDGWDKPKLQADEETWFNHNNNIRYWIKDLKLLFTDSEIRKHINNGNFIKVDKGLYQVINSERIKNTICNY